VPLGLIKSVDDAIRERADEFARRAMTKFYKAILPIYAVVRKSHTHLGTCTLIQIAEQRFLVTAAHVLDEHKKAELWVGGMRHLVRLTGRFVDSISPGGLRKQDHHDIAILQIHEALAQALGDVIYISPELMSKNRRQSEKKVLYLCIGYPNSKNKNVHATRREVDVEFWNHIGPGRLTNESLGEWAKKTTDHLFIDVPKKHAKNADGEKINAVHPKGTSGGAVFYVGDFSDVSTFSSDKECRPMLEGIIIEGHLNERVLVAVQIGVVVQAARDSGLLSATQS
jgi:hypothetical protein